MSTLQHIPDTIDELSLDDAEFVAIFGGDQHGGVEWTVDRIARAAEQRADEAAGAAVKRVRTKLIELELI